MPIPAVHIKSSSGRPIDQAKIADIIQAASDAFFQNGFAQTSIESIAAAAGVSKVTIYNRFKTKEALFVAAVEKECDSMRLGLLEDADSDGDIRDQLTRFGLNIMHFLQRKEVTRMENHLAVEAENNPEIGKLFLEAGPRRLHAALTDLLDNAVKRGALEIEDTALAAEHFAGMVKGLADMDRRFWQPVKMSDKQTSKRVADAVDLLLRGYRPA